MKFDGENLEEVLERHSRWLSEDPDSAFDDRADFSGCILRGRLFFYANLYAADFRGADVSDAMFIHCDLQRADFTGAKMRNTCLWKSNTQGAKIWTPLNCPDTGPFIAWKKCLRVVDGAVGEPVILKLLIPEDARRTNTGNDRSCKASHAKILEFQNLDGTACECDYAVSIKKKDYKYFLGETAVANGYQNDDYGYLHGPGIYFYITRQEAVYYMDLDKDEWTDVKKIAEELKSKVETRRNENV